MHYLHKRFYAQCIYRFPSTGSQVYPNPPKVTHSTASNMVEKVYVTYNQVNQSPGNTHLTLTEQQQ